MKQIPKYKLEGDGKMKIEDNRNDTRKFSELVVELLNEPVEEENGRIKFTERSIELIHQIADICKVFSLTEKRKERIETYAREKSAEDVYYDMLCKIVAAPTNMHMVSTVKLLIPVIDEKLKEKNL